MAFRITKQDNDITYGVKEFVCDAPEDINKLPKDVAMGSVAIVISTGEVYMINSSREWIKI